MVKRHTKHADGKYYIQGNKNPFDLLRGSRAQVWHGTAWKTEGGLEKKDLMKNKNGRIVSVKKHKTAKREKRLEKAGWGFKKGKFGAVRLTKSGGRRTRKRRGTRKHRR
jgi:hypothetical protein